MSSNVVVAIRATQRILRVGVMEKQILIRSLDSELPWGTAWHVRRTLRWIHPADLVGIESIDLQTELPNATKDSPEWHRRASAEELTVTGFYTCKMNSRSATITLFIRDLYRGIPRAFWWSPVITLSFARTIAHEVGHHLIAERGYVFDKGERVHPDEYEEEMANRYSFSIVQKMTKRWHYRLGMNLAKYLATVHYSNGVTQWNAKNYERAAQCWYESFRLDPDLKEAIYWYRKAKEKQLEAGIL
jgi:hypothetical protein